MLKKLLSLTFTALPVMAMADFSAMQFTTAAGKEFTVDLNGLTVSATEDGIKVQNQTGQELFDFGQLSSMEFANGIGQDLPNENQDPENPDTPDNPEGPDNPQEPDEPDNPQNPDESSIASATTDGQVNVIDLCGVSRGTYRTLADAVNSLPKGVYIGRGANGTIVKFTVKKD